ncbi:MAG: hypothetical protein JW737_00315 [Acidobacteria bacterium]|nr:hypothetical protein [Acidobacteriota bacterium]
MNKKMYMFGSHVWLIVLFFILLTGPCFAGSWIKEFSATQGTSSFFKIIKTADGNYVMMGSTNVESPTSGQNMDGMNIILVKITESGQELWRKVYGSGGYDDGYGLTEAADGSLVVTGEWDSRAGMFKTDANGNLLWSLKLDVLEGTAYAVVETDEGDFLILAESWRESYNSYRAFIARVDTSGNIIWDRSISYDGFDLWPSDLCRLGDGNYAYTGIIYWGSDMQLAYIVKIDPENNIIWYKRHRPEGFDFYTNGIEVKSFGSNDLIFLGSYDRYWWRSSTREDAAYYVMRMDHHTGEPIWVHKSAHGRIDFGDFNAGFTVLPDESIVFAGSSYNNVRYVKLDPNGNELWAYKYIGINSKVTFNSVVQTSDGGFIFAGMNQYKLLAVKTEADGSVNSPYVEPIHESNIDLNMTVPDINKETPQTEIKRKKHFSEIER